MKKCYFVSYAYKERMGDKWAFRSCLLRGQHPIDYVQELSMQGNGARAHLINWREISKKLYDKHEYSW